MIIACQVKLIQIKVIFQWKMKNAINDDCLLKILISHHWSIVPFRLKNLQIAMIALHWFSCSKSILFLDSYVKAMFVKIFKQLASGKLKYLEISTLFEKLDSNF